MSEKTVKTPSKVRLKPNIIDFLIIIVVLGAIVGIVLRAGIVEQVTMNSNMQQARVTFLIQDINDDSGDYFHIGDEFYSSTHGCDFGKLESIQIMPAEAFISTIDGQLIKTHSNNNRIDVRGTMICDGIFSEEGFLLEGINYIAPGTGVWMQSVYMNVSMTITDIEQIEAAE